VRLDDVNVLAVLDGHAGGVTGVAFHGGANQALSTGADKAVKLWDLATGKVLRTYGPLAEAPRAVAFSRDSALVGAAAGKLVKVWNAADGKEVLTLNHPTDVYGLSFSADRTRLATAAADGRARAWDVATGQELQAFLHAGPVRAVAFTPAGNTVLVAGGDDKTAAVHTVQAARALKTGRPVRALALTPNGSHVLTAGDDGKVKVWNTNNGVNERALDAGGKPVLAVAVARTNQTVAAGGADGTVRLFSFADGKLLAPVKAPGVVRGLGFSPNGQVLAAACEDGTVQTWNVVHNPGQPLPAEFGKPLQAYRHGAAATDVAFAPNAPALYTSSLDKTVKAWKLASEAPTKNFGHPNLVDAVAFDPAGTRLATGCHDGKVRIFDLAKGSVLREINAHVTPAPPAPVYCVAWSPDGKQVVSGSMDHSLKLWDAAAGTLVREFKGYKEKDFPKGHRDAVFCAAFSPDGKQLASGSSDYAIKVWNVADGSVLRELVNPNLKAGPGEGPRAHPGYVYGVRYTADGKHLVSAGGAPRNRGYLAVWSAADGKMEYGEEMALGTFYGLALAPDNKTLALGTGGTARTGQELNNGLILKMPVLK
jgi:WD40 repeat protein